MNDEAAPWNRAIAIRATFTDAFDGIARMMGEAQRLGFELRSLSVEADQRGAAAYLALTVPIDVDVVQLAARISRHPCMIEASIDEAAMRIATRSDRSESSELC